MNTELIDILIVGGPQLNYGRFDVKVRQLPFTFEGINKGCRLLPACKNVVIMPGQAIFDSLPEAKDFEWTYENSHLEHCVLKLGLASMDSKNPVPDQISRRLAEIQGDEYSRFTRSATSEFFARLCDGIYNIVDSGGDVYILMPEEYPLWPKGDKAFMIHAMPGIDVVTNSRWSRRVSGEFASMLEGTPSELVFSFGSIYSEEYPEGHFMGNEGKLDSPHKILRLLPEAAPVRWKAGAVDRAKAWRILVLSWGMGRFIFAPALSWSLILKDLGVHECAGSESLNGSSGKPDTACNDQKVSTPDGGALVKMLPQSKEEIEKWNRALGFKGIDGRRKNIKSIVDLAWTVAMLPTEVLKLKSNNKVKVYSINGAITEGELTGDALRRAIDRFSKKPELPEKLKVFLQEVQEAWKNHFLHS